MKTIPRPHARFGLVAACPGESVDASFMAAFRQSWPARAPGHCEARQLLMGSDAAKATD